MQSNKKKPPKKTNQSQFEKKSTPNLEVLEYFYSFTLGLL